jgi:hypothetical protein
MAVMVHGKARFALLLVARCLAGRDAGIPCSDGGEIPGGADFRVQPGFWLAPQKFSFSEDGDHTGVVRTKGAFGEAEGKIVFPAGFLKLRAQNTVASDAAGSGNAADV